MSTDEADKKAVIDVTVHSSDDYALRVLYALNCLDGSLRDSGDGIIIIVDSVYVPDEFHTVRKTVELSEGGSDIFIRHAVEFGAYGIDNVGIVLIMLAQKINLI